MERELNIEVPGMFMKSFIKALNRGYIPISIYVEDPPKELYYIKLVYDEDYKYIGIKYDIDKPQPGELFKSYVTMPYFHLPPGIQSDIVSRTKQKNCIGFLLSISSGAYSGGFTWDKSPEGHCFWQKVLNDKKYDIYFEKFPKAPSIYDELVTGVHSGSDFGIDWDKFKTISTRIDTCTSPCFPYANEKEMLKAHGKGLLDQINDTWEYKAFSKEELDKAIDKMANEYLYKYGFKPEDLEHYKSKFNYENQLQKQKVDLSGRDGAKSVRLCNRRNKIRVAKLSLGYKEVSGRS